MKDFEDDSSEIDSIFASFATPVQIPDVGITNKYIIPAPVPVPGTFFN